MPSRARSRARLRLRAADLGAPGRWQPIRHGRGHVSPQTHSALHGPDPRHFAQAASRFDAHRLRQGRRVARWWQSPCGPHLLDAAGGTGRADRLPVRGRHLAHRGVGVSHIPSTSPALSWMKSAANRQHSWIRPLWPMPPRPMVRLARRGQRKRTGEARGDPRSAAGPVGRVARPARAATAGPGAGRPRSHQGWSLPRSNPFGSRFLRAFPCAPRRVPRTTPAPMTCAPRDTGPRGTSPQ